MLKLSGKLFIFQRDSAQTLSAWGNQRSCQMLTDLNIFLQAHSAVNCSKFSLKMPQYPKYLAAVPYDL